MKQYPCEFARDCSDPEADGFDYSCSKNPDNCPKWAEFAEYEERE